MPAPDSLLAQAQQEIAGGSHTELDSRQQTLGGIATVAGTQSGMASQMTDLNKVGEGRNTYLQLKVGLAPCTYVNNIYVYMYICIYVCRYMYICV